MLRWLYVDGLVYCALGDMGCQGGMLVIGTWVIVVRLVSFYVVRVVACFHQMRLIGLSLRV